MKALAMKHFEDAPLGIPISPVSNEMLNAYAESVTQRLGLHPKAFFALGEIGNSVHAAEFLMLGPESYRTSVAMPVRNILYSYYSMDRVWMRLLHCGLDVNQRIFDFGCGMGCLLYYLWLSGATDLWGWDVDGVQKELATEILTPLGVHWGWSDRADWVVSLAVFEHLARPTEAYERLRELGGRMILGFGMDPEPAHIAPRDELLELQKRVVADGGFYLD